MTKTTNHAARSRKAIDILKAEGTTVETFASKEIGRKVTVPESLTPQQENLIYRFAKHYAITQKMAKAALVNGGWDWSRALDEVTTIMKASLGKNA